MGRLSLFHLVKYILWILRFLSDCLSEKIFSHIYKNKKIPLPPIRNKLLLQSASSLATKIRDGELKSEDLVKAYISRIQEVNGILNAVVGVRFPDAIQEAREIDLRIASGVKSKEEMARDTPFLGVPFTVKECFSVNGMPHSAGLVSMKNNSAIQDAPAVGLLRKAGAIVLGVTNISELCMWWESNNKVYGRTTNPYDTTRTPGGSSGGEGSIIAAAGSLMGIGSDIGGSVRIPAFFNGIFGHKPTVGMISTEGQLPPCEGELRQFLTTGPIARYATDLVMMYKVLAHDNATSLKLDTPVAIDKLKIYYMENDGGFPLVSDVDPELITSMHKVINYFDKAYRIKAEKVNITELYYTAFIWEHQMKTKSPKTFSQLLKNGKGEINPFCELLKWTFQCSDHTLPALLVSISEKISNKDPDYINSMNSKFETLKKRFQILLGENGVFLYPSCAVVAPYHHQPIFQPLNFIYAAIFNMLGLPATQCPLGVNSQGIPLGIQVVGNLYQDRNTLAVALELEKAFGGWLPPCPVFGETNNL